MHPPPDRLIAFRAGQVPAREAEDLKAHLAGCAACRELAKSLDAGTLPAAPSAQGAATLPSPGPAAESPSAIPPELANHPRYRIVELLGSGGMGSVYKAEHQLMERVVALKVINRSLTDNPAMVERFRREVKAAAKLAHPNIVTAHDAEQAGELHFLVMEFVEGTSLDRLVAREGPLPVAKACEYIRQAALGLQHAFARGMVHRDIKPQNLMLTQAHGPQSVGLIKVLDFGLARFAMEVLPAGALLQETPGEGRSPDSLTQVGTVIGTPDYIAPEQARDAHAADIRADIYSLGCTLYDVLAGRPPFPEGTAVQKVLAHAERTPRPLTELRKDVPAALARVVAKMMAKEPEQRYQTPAEAAEALTPFTGLAASRDRWGRRLLRGAVYLLALGLGGCCCYFGGYTAMWMVRAPEPEDTQGLSGTWVKVRGGGRTEGTWAGGRRDGMKPATEPRQPVRSAEPGPGGWIALFNGKDLTGWKPLPVGANNWHVQDGILIGAGRVSPTHLFSEDGGFENFHARVEARINDGGNSSLYFRAAFGLQQNGYPQGYEAQINSTQADPIRTGSLYFPMIKEVLVHEQLHQPDEWFTLEVIAQGNHLVLAVNDKGTVDYLDQKNTYRKGHFALQQLSATTRVAFRKIEVRELPSK